MGKVIKIGHMSFTDYGKIRCYTCGGEFKKAPKGHKPLMLHNMQPHTEKYTVFICENTDDKEYHGTIQVLKESEKAMINKIKDTSKEKLEKVYT